MSALHEEFYPRQHPTPFAARLETGILAVPRKDNGRAGTNVARENVPLGTGGITSDECVFGILKSILRVNEIGRNVLVDACSRHSSSR